MHTVNSTQFFVTLAISLASTFLVSRFLLLLLRPRAIGLRKVAIADGASFAICYTLLVIWCSTATKIYWFAGHVVFAPHVLLYIYDLLHWTDDESEVGEVSQRLNT